jgi:hypothetical protein
MMEREEDDDSWQRDLIVQHVRTQSLASVISAKSIQTFGGEIASMEQYTHQDPQPMNKAKMRNALERKKLEEDRMSILLLLSPSQRRPPQQHVEFAGGSDAYLEWHKPK